MAVQLMAVQQQANIQGEVNWELHYVDGTMVRAHQHAAGARGDLAPRYIYVPKAEVS